MDNALSTLLVTGGSRPLYLHVCENLSWTLQEEVDGFFASLNGRDPTYQDAVPRQAQAP